MIERIRREAAAAPLPFSGERLTSAVSGQIETEHHHRYLLAREFCRGRDVLDVASGEGYGTALLAQVARHAVGVEIDGAVVEAARTEFAHSTLEFRQGDARALPLEDASIDVVVSFETLEHLEEHDIFLKELHRVLRRDGLLIISTPDIAVYSSGDVAANPFHVHELGQGEFETLLAAHFAHHAITRQRAVIGSVILRAGHDLPVRAYERAGDAVIEGEDHFARAPYLIALASNAALPTLPNSVYVTRADLDTDWLCRLEAEQGQRTAEQARLEAEQGQRHAEQARREAEARASTTRARMAELKRRFDLQAQRAAAAEAAARVAHDQAEAEAAAAASAAADRAASLEQRLALIETSTTWRASRVLREAGGRHPEAARLLRRTLKLTWWTASLQLRRKLEQRRLDLAEIVPAIEAPAPAPATISARGIRIETVATPEVSVIICAYGQTEATLACLRSIARHALRRAIEVIVIDDAFPDRAAVAPLGEVGGIILHRNPANMGFLRSCNEAARLARGRFLLLLNNDTELLPGAIDALADQLDDHPEIGLVGAQLRFPDGRLQEAGGILWNDASGWNFGRGDDPGLPQYCYPREVDFCSGAALMLGRDLFEQLGGFDVHFAPAYYEDVDLAFRVRQSGLRVVYEPRAMVVHHEGLSHGTDLSAGVKAHQVTNQARFRERWAGVLDVRHFAPGAHVLRARDRGHGRRSILVIDHYVPEPDRDAGSRSVMGIMHALIAAGWVVKFWPHNRAHVPVYTAALERAGIEVIDQRWPGGFGEWIRGHGGELDHVMMIRPEVAADMLAQMPRGGDMVLSYYGVDLHFARMRRQAALTGSAGSNDGAAGSAGLLEEAAAMERLERRVWRSFDVVIYPSEEEAEAVRAFRPAAPVCAIVPFCFDPLPPRPTVPTERTILFVAGFAHPPNVDAALFLMRELLPRLVQLVGPVHVTLAGSNPTAAVQALAGSGAGGEVTVTGYVTDAALDELYARSRVAIVPLRFGAGVKGKVVQALSHGLPLVTTTTGAQGIPGLAGVVAVHDEVDALVASLQTLLVDDSAWLARSQAQMAFARAHFSPDAMRRSVLEALAAAEASAGFEARPPLS